MTETIKNKTHSDPKDVYVECFYTSMRRLLVEMIEQIDKRLDEQGNNRPRPIPDAE